MKKKNIKSFEKKSMTNLNPIIGGEGKDYTSPWYVVQQINTIQ